MIKLPSEDQNKKKRKEKAHQKYFNVTKALMWTLTDHSPMHYCAQEALHGKHKESLCHYSNTVVAKPINTDTTKQVEP